MKKLVLLLLMTTAVVFGQEPISKKIGEFHTLKIFNGLTVELDKSAQNKIEIYGSQADLISVKNSDGILKIRVNILEGFKADGVRIVLKNKEDIQIIDANEGSVVTSEKQIKQEHLEVKVQEGARVMMAVNTKHLFVKAVSGGVVQLEGKAEYQRIEANTGAIYEGFKVGCDEAEVLSATGARVEVEAKNRLDAKVRLRGIIYYKGNPEVLLTKKMVGGTIQRVD